MGYKYEVLVWVKDSNEYNNKQVYASDSLLKALRVMWSSKKTAGCVTFRWR